MAVLASFCCEFLRPECDTPVLHARNVYHAEQIIYYIIA